MQREFIFTDKWLEIVFKNRNQSYGAYVLRKRLPRNILIGYLAALIFMSAVLFTLYQFSQPSMEKMKGLLDELATSIIYEVKPDKIQIPPKSNPESKSSFPKPSSNNFIPVVKDCVNVEEDKKEILKFDANADSKDTSAMESNMDAIGKDTGSINEPVTPFNAAGVEKVPEFKGGTASLAKFMINHTHYPEFYVSQEKGGIVYVSFVVDSTGKVTDVKAKNEIEGYPEFAVEAVKAVSKMPYWIPGQQAGRNVPVIMILPVKFTVKKDF